LQADARNFTNRLARNSWTSAEHRLAALVTAKRGQPFSQAVVDLKGNVASDSIPTDNIRAAGIPVYQFGGQMTLDSPVILLRRPVVKRMAAPKSSARCDYRW